MKKYVKKTMETIKKEGLIVTCTKMKQFYARFKAVEKLKKETGLNWSLFDTNLEATPYDSQYQENEDYSSYNAKGVKPLAFYLPQFHRIRENDEWWGEGFTEWTNTRKASPQYEGHYQPRVPHKDFGYYDLTDIHTIRKQTELAKMHGIYGFCFYYYWFSGRRMMEKPVDLLLAHPEIEMPFCLCWANENFTRNWDGLKSEILLEQKYTIEDREGFITDIKPYLDDSRYIKIKGKPVILVYNPGEIIEIEKTFEAWRKKAMDIGIGEILIWLCRTGEQTAESLGVEAYVDGEVEFPPRNIWHDILSVSGIETESKGNLFNYTKLAEVKACQIKTEKNHPLPLFRTCMTGWDNTARRKTDWISFYGYSLKSFYSWTANIVQNALHRHDEASRFFFINAWNEWAEGTYLEPDEKYGYANINTFSKALFGLPFESILRLEGESKEISSLQEKTQIAVQVHLFYTDMLPEVIEACNCIPHPFDCFVSTDTEEKKQMIQQAFAAKSAARQIFVEVFENRGRDVRPFLLQMQNAYSDYRYICHIHTKKTLNDDYGVMWCRYLYKNLLDSKEHVNTILSLFEENAEIGMIFPEDYPLVAHQVEWGGNEEGCKKLLQNLDIQAELELDPIFPVGNMFWAKTKAIAKLFDHVKEIDYFEDEAAQINLTLAHRLERIWGYVIRDAGYRHQKIYNACRKPVCLQAGNRLAIFVHYDQNHSISLEDRQYLRALRECVHELIFVTNAALDQDELAKIKNDVTKIVQRDNIGFDFGAWREILLHMGQEKIAAYDEIILANNSNVYVNQNLKNMLYDMEKRAVDFWGVTLFPYCRDGSFIGEPCIKAHIQSYFLVFNHSVLSSPVFWKFWENMKMAGDWHEAIKKYETKMTDYFSKAGFSYDYYIHESKTLCGVLNSYAIPYEYPAVLVLLDSPFVKKKAGQYMNAVEEIRLKNLIGEKMKDHGSYE